MNVTDLVRDAAGVVIVAGALLIALGAFGLVRLPDVLCRSHAASKALTLGMVLMLVGFWLTRPGAGYWLALAILFQVISIPLSSHLLVRAAHDNRVPRHRPGSSTPAGEHKRR